MSVLDGHAISFSYNRLCVPGVTQQEIDYFKYLHFSQTDPDSAQH